MEDESVLVADTGIDLQGIRCVVIGAGGFIGTNLCRALLDRAAVVRGFGRSSRFPAVLRDVEWIEGSVDDSHAVARAVDGQEIVYHLLGSSTPALSNLDPSTELLRTSASTLSLLEQCRAKRVRRVIFASSGGTVYGVPTSVPVAETAPTAPISAYGLGKLMGEQFFSLYDHLYGVEHIALRIANPYGPYQTDVASQGIIAAALTSALKSRPLEIWGDGEVIRDFVYIGDVCEAFVRATAYRGPHRVFNVGSGQGRSINSVVADLDRILRPRHLRTVYRPARPADVPVSVLDIERSRCELGWRPLMPWDTGLALTLTWLVEALPGG